MRDAIVTRALHATYRRGRRVKATCGSSSLTLPYDHALDLPSNHRRAAEALAQTLGWALGDGGVMESGYVFLLA